MKSVSFCTTCMGRLQHLAQTLPQNIVDNLDYPRVEFVVVDYNSQDGLAEWVRRHLSHWIKAGILNYYHYPAPGSFHMAHAKNMAHRLATGEILCNMDADNFTGKGFAHYLNHAMQETGTFIRTNTIETSRQIYRGGGGGRIAVPREAFYAAGGYDEVFERWGPDDLDFHARLKRIGYKFRSLSPKYLNFIRHENALRNRNYRDPVDIRPGNRDIAFRNVVYNTRSQNTIANFGHFGCGTVYKNFAAEPLHLQPLPTRVFGIGWHKTATTSLQAALKILRIPGQHYPYPLYPEIRAGKAYYPTAHFHYALTDFPVPMVYRQLDAMYPGAKFILTIRPVEKWLASAEKHFQLGHSPHPGHTGLSYWDVKEMHGRYSHSIHELAYGQRYFDAQVFASRYVRHNQEILEYFYDRPDDLLVLDIEQPDNVKWQKLCRFLDVPQPDMAFPHMFSTKSRLA